MSNDPIDLTQNRYHHGEMDELLVTEFLGRTVREELIAAAVLAGGILVSIVIRAIATALLKRRSNRSEEDDDSLVRFGLSAVKTFLFPALILASLYGALSVIRLEGTALTVTNGIFVVVFSFLTIRFVISVTNEGFRRAASREGGFDFAKVRPLRSIVVFVIWIAGLLFLLDNLGFDITAVVAGLGIGGIAVALASQALLGDLFSYFVILFDRPFEIGDFLIFGDTMGSVEKIGIKTTRIRGVTGEQISVSNSDLTGSRTRNFGRLEKRLVIFTVGVTYGTSAEKLRRIPRIIEEAVSREEQATFARAHFKSYGEWNLVFEAVYTALTSDYGAYMDIQERINLRIYESFESEGVEFAFPTQTVNVSGAVNTVQTQEPRRP